MPEAAPETAPEPTPETVAVPVLVPVAVPVVESEPEPEPFRSPNVEAPEDVLPVAPHPEKREEQSKMADAIVTPVGGGMGHTVVLDNADRGDRGYKVDPWTLKSIQDFEGRAQAHMSDIRREVTEKEGDVERAVQVSRAELGGLVISGNKDVALQNATNTAALQAALAECCCEIKELVRADGQTTRALIESNRAADLTRQLSEANNKATLLAALGKLPAIAQV